MGIPRISVIIPCYNMGQYVGECLDSVLSQSLSEIEVICVNDGSTDSTLQILEQYQQKDARIIIIDQTNQGVAAARNTAIGKASGEYIAFMDPDDFYPNAHTLELLYTKAHGSHALICGGSYSDFSNTSKKVWTNYRGDYALYTHTWEGITDYRDYQFDFGFQRFLYKRTLLLENNIFFPPYVRFEDPPFLVRAMIAAGSFYAVPDVVYRYRNGNASASVTWSDAKACDTLRGFMDDLTLSVQHHLSQLHALTVRRIELGPAKAPIINTLRSGNQEAFSLLKKISETICPQLLEEAGMQPDADGGYILRGYENWLTAASLEEGNAKMIPVVMAADENYVIPMSVTIASLLCNAAPETRYDIYILIPEEFSAVSKLLLQQFEQRHPGCKINFLVMKDAFSDASLTVKHITKVTYYRLLIHALLPQYDKCIYLDTDLVVNKDLGEFYRTDMENYYLAGVKAAGYMSTAEEAARHIERLGVPSVENYINAGVLIMNLDKIRKDGLRDRFIELSTQPLESQDQDILNLICYNHIKILPPRFNLMSKYIQRVDGGYCFNQHAGDVYSEEEKHTALTQPAIIHFADRKKPWTDPESVLSEFWFKYIPYSTFYFDQLYQKYKSREIRSQKENLQLKKMNQQYKNKLLSARRELVSIKGSVSFRIGRMITYIPRKLRGCIRCCREHGFGYTVRRAFARIFGKNQ